MRSAGFSLIELILVIVILGVSLAGLASMFSGSTIALATGEEVQKTAQYAQECAERVVAVRRNLGFTGTGINNTTSGNITSTLCDPSPDGYTRTLTLGPNYAGSSCSGTTCSGCPSGAICRDVTISVQLTNGSGSSSIQLMLANY